MTMRKLFLLFNLSLAVCTLRAQNQWVNWNSSNGGISFKSGSAQLFTGVPKNLQYPDYTGQRSFSYADPQTGALLFLTDGQNIWNKNYRSILFPPGDTLRSCDSDYYKVQIVPFSDDPNRFYLFHMYSARGIVSEKESGVPKGCNDANVSALYYSVLEMNYPAATGKLLVKNQPLLKLPLDKVMLVKHANKKDTWVIGHAWDSAYYSAFLVTDEKINAPVRSIIGPDALLPASNIRSSVAVSPDGKRIAASGSASYVEIYDFNNSTGELSNYRTITLTKEYVTALSFSPDNSKLYIAVGDAKLCDNYAKIYQVNFDESDLNKSLFMVKKYPPRRLDLGLGKDNHIWIKGATYPDVPGSYFDLIWNPNQPKNACMVKERYMPMGFQPYFPNIPNGTIEQPKEIAVTKMNFPDTVVACLGVYSINAAPGYQTYRWNTGDTTPSINVREPGLYSVIAGKKGFMKPDSYGYVYVKSSGGEVFAAEDTFYCPKKPHLLVVPSHIGNIKWSDGDSSRIKTIYAPGEYKLLAVNNNNGCKVWDSICVSIHETPMVDFGADTSMCDRNQLILKLKAFADTSGSRVTSSTFLWQDGSKKSTYNVNEPGIYWGQNSFNGCTVVDTIVVRYIPMPVIKLGNDTALCDKESLRLTVPYLAAANYTWSTGQKDTSLIVGTAGKYWVKATNEFCVETDSIAVEYKPLPKIALGNDTTICEGTKLVLKPSTENTYQYQWVTGDGSPQLTINTAGIYGLKALLNGCAATDSITVYVMKTPSLRLTDTFMCNEMKMILDPHVSLIDNVKWQDGSVGHTFTVFSPGVYTVTATNRCGSDQASVKVISKLCEVVMPTAFSPNGDNVNDYFRIKYPDIVRSMNLVVFNRFGQKIFESSDIYKGWDGRYKGSAQNPGTYVWKLRYTDVNGDPHSLNGYVVLIR